jgi:DASH complex subunit DAD2
MSRHQSSRPGFTSGSFASNQALQARIDKKTRELQDAKQLQQLSGTLVSQLEDLTAKLDTLANGTAKVALILANWSQVLRAVGLAQGALPVGEEEEEEEEETITEMKLPVPLVRIQVEEGPDEEQQQ